MVFIYLFVAYNTHTIFTMVYSLLSKSQKIIRFNILNLVVLLSVSEKDACQPARVNLKENIYYLYKNLLEQYLLKKVFYCIPPFFPNSFDALTTYSSLVKVGNRQDSFRVI